MFDLLITNPLTNLVLLFYHLVGENLGFAIILFTICLRIFLLPLTVKQIRQQRKMAELQPKLQELQKQRGTNKQMSAEELAIVRQTAGSCLGGCLPLLIQLPIFIGLNIIITKISDPNTTGAVFNDALYFDFLKYAPDYKFNTDFFGFNLAVSPSQAGWSLGFIPYAILIVLLVLTQYFQSALMMAAQSRKKKEAPKPKANDRKLTPKETEKAEMQEEMQRMMQMQTKYVLPLIIGTASYSFSAALGVYWLTQNLFAIVQTYVQNKIMDNKQNPKKNATEKFREASYENVENNVEEKTPEQPEVSAVTKKDKKHKNNIKSKKKKNKR